MKESSPRFVTPMSTPRPRGSRRLTAYSPKLGRTVRAFDHSAFEQWVRLEVDPGVVSFCEHPCRVGAADDGALIDFWVAGVKSCHLLACFRREASRAMSAASRWQLARPDPSPTLGACSPEDKEANST